MKIRILFSFFIPIILLASLLGCRAKLTVSRNDEIRDGEEKGYLIIQALEEFQSDNGQYPQSLDDLVPDYIDGIPSTITGFPITYEQTHDGFVVRFETLRRGKPKTICDYDKRLPNWDCSFYIGEN